MAEYSVFVGPVGVTALLLAFALNLFGIVDQENRLYIWINFLGAALSCWASMLIAYVPFVILEGAWALARRRSGAASRCAGRSARKRTTCEPSHAGTHER